MASPSSTKSDDKILIPKLVNKKAKSPTNPDDERLITKLVNEEAKQRSKRDDRQLSNPKAKIQKVQPYLRERQQFAEYYFPKLLSIGPIHHERGMNYKLMWTATHLEVEDKCTCREAAKELLEKIKVKIDELKGFYSEDVIEGVDHDELARMFLLDGCAVLHFMKNACVKHPENLKIKVDQLVVVHHDLLLLENQLPYQLLKLLCNDDEAKLVGYINNFLEMHHMMPPDHKIKLPEGGSEEAIITVDHPTHLLDVLRTAILKGQTPEKGRKSVQEWPTYRNIQELKSAGIEVIKNQKQSRLTDISFTCRCIFAGKLHLSRLVVDDSTATTFLNLIAYEMCPDFENYYEISSYVAFLDSLIDHPDDVKMLRKAGVLHNSLGSDEEVAILFNTIATDLVPNGDIYAEVIKQLENHYSKPIITRMAELYTNHFSSPWSAVAFLAAFLALALTCVQTWLAIPRDEPPPPPCMKICGRR